MKQSLYGIFGLAVRVRKLGQTNIDTVNQEIHAALNSCGFSLKTIPGISNVI